MTRMELICLVDDYVLGFAIRAQFMAYRARAAGVSDERWREVVLDYARQRLEGGDFPTCARSSRPSAPRAAASTSSCRSTTTTSASSAA
jgi:hypothetical protein